MLPTINTTQFYIDGQWVDPIDGKLIEVRSPATQEVVGRMPMGGVKDIDRAVAAARKAFDTSPWPWLPMVERGKYLSAMADELERRSQDLAVITTAESGQPLEKNVRFQIGVALASFRYYAGLCDTYQIEERKQGLVTPFIVRKEPVGVVGTITPWNAPIVITSFSVPAALAAGCTIVLKPAPESPLHAQLLGEIAAAVGLPAGVLNIVPADREPSEALVSHPGVDKISFTGSTATGRRVASICGEQLKRYSLELGGKSAAIVLDDADLDQAIPWIAAFSTMNSCEACVGQTRILVPRSRYDEFVDKFTGAITSLRMGDPFDADTDMGPLIAERQRDKVEGYIQSGIEQGARVLTGGGRLPGQDRGWFIEPTVLADVTNDMTVAQEEIFGPVLCVIPYDGTDEEAVRIANDSDYGLSGTVWTTNTERGLEVARRVRTGNYGINIFHMDTAAPFGGFKQSGVGRQLGVQGLEGYFELKSIHLPA